MKDGIDLWSLPENLRMPHSALDLWTLPAHSAVEEWVSNWGMCSIFPTPRTQPEPLETLSSSCMDDLVHSPRQLPMLAVCSAMCCCAFHFGFAFILNRHRCSLRTFPGRTSADCLFTHCTTLYTVSCACAALSFSSTFRTAPALDPHYK